MANNNRCVICWAEIPEGRMVCPDCEKRVMDDDNGKGIDRKSQVGTGRGLGLYLGHLWAALDRGGAKKRNR